MHDNLFQRRIKELLKSLSTLHNDVSRLSEMIHDDRQAINEQHKAEEKSRNEPRSVITTLSTPVTIGVEAETHERKGVWDKIFRGIEVAGIAAVTVYAIITYQMWKEMNLQNAIASGSAQEARMARRQAQKVLDATLDQFHLDQRAWVGLNESFAQYTTEGNDKRFTFRISIKNTGKTPARNLLVTTMASHQDIRQAPPTWKDLVELNREFDARSKMQSQQRENDLKRQGIPIPRPLFHPSMIAPPVTVLAPGATQDAPIVNEFFTEERLNHLRSRAEIEAIEYILVRISYEDVFSHTQRVTQLCFRYHTPNDVKSCPMENFMN